MASSIAMLELLTAPRPKALSFSDVEAFVGDTQPPPSSGSLPTVPKIPASPEVPGECIFRGLTLAMTAECVVNGETYEATSICGYATVRGLGRAWYGSFDGFTFYLGDPGPFESALPAGVALALGEVMHAAIYCEDGARRFDHSCRRAGGWA